MTTVIYVARAQAVGGEGYKATFPDLPGCAATGGDLASLIANARQELTAKLEALENAGEAWPAATPIEQLPLDPGAFHLPVDVAVDDPPVRVNISLGERLLQRLDAAAEARGMTRSGFIAQSVRVSLGDATRVGDDFAAGGRRLQDELSLLGRRITESIGPESPFARRMNELDDRVYDGVRMAADTVSAAMTRRRRAHEPSETDPHTPPPGPEEPTASN